MGYIYTYIYTDTHVENTYICAVLLACVVCLTFLVGVVWGSGDLGPESSKHHFRGLQSGAMMWFA